MLDTTETASITADPADKREFYRGLAAELTALIGDEPDAIANAANTAALIFNSLPGINWAGFYFLQGGGELVLGPFQGKPACIRIAIGSGVCGTAAERRASVRVDDVHEFAGHIACDAASQSELVVPLLNGDRLLGVLDLVSPVLARFDAEDQAGIEALAAIYAGSVRRER